MKKLVIVLIVLVFAAPAMASDFQFYGKVRLHLGYYETDDDFDSAILSGPQMDPTISGPDDSGVLLNISKSTRFGVNFKTHDALTGRVELGLNEEDDENVYLRQIYGEWNFGPGKLLMGKAYTPATFLGYSGMKGDLTDGGHGNLVAAGLPYVGRRPQLKLSFGDFNFALIQPHGSVGVFGSDKDQYIPRVEAAYVFRTSIMNIRPVVGFQTYDVDMGAGDDETVTSFVGGLGVSLKLGRAYIKATGSYFQNPGNYGNSDVMILPYTTYARFVDGSVEDADVLTGTFVVGARLNSRFTIEGGFAYEQAEVDIASGVTEEKAAMVYYLQAPITIAKGFYLTPEIAVLDRGDQERTGSADVDLGKMTYFDITFEVVF